MPDALNGDNPNAEPGPADPDLKKVLSVIACLGSSSTAGKGQAFDWINELERRPNNRDFAFLTNVDESIKYWPRGQTEFTVRNWSVFSLAPMRLTHFTFIVFSKCCSLSLGSYPFCANTFPCSRWPSSETA